MFQRPRKLKVQRGDGMDSIYFDHAATTRLHPYVKNAMLPYLEELYGNASSHYDLGEKSRAAIEESREIIAASINARPEEIYFTSGGTESDNWAIKGMKNRYHFHPMHIVTSSIEHHAILRSLKDRWNEREDTLYTMVNPEPSGVIDPGKVADAFKLNTELCSIMMVNNELGTIQPIDEIGAMCEDNGITLHTDAVQAFGHMPIDVKRSHIKLLSASGHKIHGPKGIGFLFVSNDVKKRYVPLISGGQQEKGLRAGTENVACIVGLGKATEIAMDKMAANEEHERKIRDLILVQINQLDGVHVNGKIESMDPRHLNIRIDGCRGEELQALFNEQKIYLSTGSACNSNSGQPSHVLKAIGLTDEEANSSIRISIGDNNTEEEAMYFIECLKQNISILRTNC